MTNTVSVTIQVTNNLSSQLKSAAQQATQHGQQAGSNFSSGFSKSMGSGATGALFGGKNSSVTSSAQQAGQLAGQGFSRGLLQKFQQNMGSGLLSGLFGTSGGQKLFGSAGSTVVQSAAMQGNAVGQGLASGLNSSLNKASQQANSTIGNLLSGSGSGSASTSAKNAGQSAGKQYSGGFLGSIAMAFTRFHLPVIGGSGGKGGGPGTGGAGGTAMGVVGGAMPGMMGVSGLMASAVGVGGSILGAVPAVGAIAAGLGVLAGGFTLLEKGSATFAAKIKSDFSSVGATMMKAVQPLAGPFLAAFSQLAGFIKSIGPELGRIFGAAAPLIQPLLKGLEALVSALLPGLLKLLDSAGPAFSALANILGTLGKDLGTMFSGFAPVIAASSQIFNALADVLSALFPIIGKIADELATSLAPIFTQLAGIVKNLLPVFTIIGQVIAQFAGAVLTDLVSVFSALGTFITDITPSLKTLAGALGQVFNMLENTGVFATLANAIESLAGPLANLVNALVKGLAPYLPQIVQTFSQLAQALTGGLVTILTGLANGLTSLIKAAPPRTLELIASALISWMVVSKLTGLFNSLVGVVTKGVSAVLKFATSMSEADIAAAANPIGLVVIAIAALAAAFYLAWEKSALFRDIVKDIGSVVLGMGIIVVQGLKLIVDATLDFFGAIINGAVDAFGWVPGLGGKLHQAQNDFNGFRDSVDGAFNKMIDTMQGWQDGLNNANSTAKAVSGQIVKDFDDQQKAAETAKSGIDDLSSAVTKNGNNSDAAKKARQQLITDLENAGVKSTTAKTDVDNYSTAVAKNGTTSTQAQRARQQLITDIFNASQNAKQGKTDLANYTSAVENDGAQSNAAKSARQQLIKDLENAGLSAKAATTLVNNLTGALKGIPGKTNAWVQLLGTGSGGIELRTQGPTSELEKIEFSALSGGGRLGGFGGGDQLPALLEPGETVVDKDRTRRFASVFRAMGVPGFASGGVAGLAAGVPGVVPTAANDAWGIAAKATAAMEQAFASKAQTSLEATLKAGGVYIGAGSGNYAADITAVLNLLGMPLSLVGNWLAQIATESGGNLNAVNLSDSNAAAGHPSVGLLQIIPGTFAAFSGPYRNTPPLVNYGGGTVSENPMAQIYTAIKYADIAYGGAQGMANAIGHGHGYDSGGWLPTGRSIAVNNTGRPEQVIGPGGINVTLEIASTGNRDFDSVMLEWVRNQVRIKGGGNVQKALGR